jgi:hypothetical protein
LLFHSWSTYAEAFVSSFPWLVPNTRCFCFFYR